MIQFLKYTRKACLIIELIIKNVNPLNVFYSKIDTEVIERINISLFATLA